MSPESEGPRFGLDPSKVVSELRRFANAIERGEIVLRSFGAGPMLRHGEWPGREVRIEFVEVKRP